MTITELMKEAHRIAVEHGWWEGEEVTPRNFGEQLALFHSEISEALEEWRKGHPFTEIYYEGISSAKPEGIPIELADLLIRVFDTCARYGIDLENALVLKMAYNESRPYRHGGKLA